MAKEIERRFTNINADEFLAKLEEVGAKEIHSKFKLKRQTFDLPESLKESGEKKWGRIRDEGDKITLTLKRVKDNTINGTEEFEVIVNSFEEGVKLLDALGLMMGPYQENYRHKFVLDECEITIDEWPGLEPFVEIEGKEESVVRSVIEKLGFNFSEGHSGAIDDLYESKYGISNENFNNIKVLTFDNFSEVLTR